MTGKLPVFFCCLLLLGTARSQVPAIGGRLRVAVERLEKDSSMRHAIISLCVREAGTNRVIFERNAQVGVAPASCQKLLTSVAALDLLGPDYRYRTRVGYRGTVTDGALNGDLYIAGSGDPTLGSWRWDSTKEEVVLGRWVRMVQLAGIKSYTGTIILDDRTWGTDAVPGGWIWEDIGNYYGAGAWGLDWRENQYDVRLQAGESVGDPVKITNLADLVKREMPVWINELTTGPAGSGDNSYIYQPPYGEFAILRGTAPLQKEETVISGSLPHPARHVALLWKDALKKAGIIRAGDKFTSGGIRAELALEPADSTIHPDNWIGESVSPALDSINYWFLRRSINLYGEALVKTLALEKKGVVSTEGGVGVVKDFWAGHGIDRAALHILDGSGLSPQNRVTTDALVKVLQYARTRPWFKAFYNSLPMFNGMHMKSGSIGGARSFSGYQTGADGKEYVFSIIVNNYDGSSGEAVKKLYGILDNLKK